MRVVRLATAMVGRTMVGWTMVGSACAVACCLSAAEAEVRISIDLDSQTMHVEAKDQTFDWQISSGKDGYETPPGTYKVLWMDRDHHSDEYDGASMPNAIFFAPGFAIHGFGRSPWGHPASHGCVRLPVAKSAILFALVKKEGAAIEITGGAPDAVGVSGARRLLDGGAIEEGAIEEGAIAPRRGGVLPGEPGYPALTAADPLAGIMR